MPKKIQYHWSKCSNKIRYLLMNKEKKRKDLDFIDSVYWYHVSWGHYLNLVAYSFIHGGQQVKSRLFQIHNQWQILCFSWLKGSNDLVPTWTILTQRFSVEINVHNLHLMLTTVLLISNSSYCGNSISSKKVFTDQHGFNSLRLFSV